MGNELTPERLAEIRAWLMADDDDIAEADGEDALTFAEGCVLDLLSYADALVAEVKRLRGRCAEWQAADDAAVVRTVNRSAEIDAAYNQAVDDAADVHAATVSHRHLVTERIRELRKP